MTTYEVDYKVYGMDKTITAMHRTFKDDGKLQEWAIRTFGKGAVARIRK